MDRRQVAIAPEIFVNGLFQLTHDYSNQGCQSTNTTWVNEKKYYDSTSRHQWTKVDSDQIKFGSMKDNGDFSFCKMLIIASLVFLTILATISDLSTLFGLPKEKYWITRKWTKVNFLKVTRGSIKDGWWWSRDKWKESMKINHRWKLVINWEREQCWRTENSLIAEGELWKKLYVLV